MKLNFIKKTFLILSSIEKTCLTHNTIAYTYHKNKNSTKVIKIKFALRFQNNKKTSKPHTSHVVLTIQESFPICNNFEMLKIMCTYKDQHFVSVIKNSKCIFFYNDER